MLIYSLDKQYNKKTNIFKKSNHPHQSNAKSMEFHEHVKIWLDKHYERSEIPFLVEAVYSDDREKQHYGAIGLRKLLSDSNTYIQVFNLLY